MPTIITRGAASAKGFGFGASTGLSPIPDTSIVIGNSSLLGIVNLYDIGITAYFPSNNPYVFTMSQDGIYAYFQDYNSTVLYQFKLGTPYDITTLTSTVIASVDLGVLGMMGGSWNATGTYYSARQWSAGPIYVWAVGTPWMINTFSGGSVGGPGTTSYVFAIDVTGNFGFTSPANIQPTKSYTGSWTSGWTGGPTSYSYAGSSSTYCTFPSYGSKRAFVISDDTNSVNQIDMSTAGDLNTASNGSSRSFASIVVANGRNTMGVMIGQNNYWYMMAQRASGSNRYVSWWKTGT
jgi:hypothetical protein